MKIKAVKRLSDAGQPEQVEERLSQEKYSFFFTACEVSKNIRKGHQKLSHYLTFSFRPFVIPGFILVDFFFPCSVSFFLLCIKINFKIVKTSQGLFGAFNVQRKKKKI